MPSTSPSDAASDTPSVAPPSTPSVALSSSPSSEPSVAPSGEPTTPAPGIVEENGAVTFLKALVVLDEAWKAGKFDLSALS